jgi:hypothetical protein
MKTLAIITCIVLSINLQAQKTKPVTSGPQGGVINRVENYNIELVNSISRVSVYLYDSSLAPVSNDGVLSEIIFCYPEDECLNKNMTTLGKNGYTVSLANAHFAYCDVNLIINGKPITTKFTNTSALAEGK